MRREGDRRKEEKNGDFREAEVAYRENATARQRYKGWRDEPAPRETTMDPTVRRLLRVQIDDAIEADRVHAHVATRSNPGREFIEQNAPRRQHRHLIRRQRLKK
jgi:DNA gyrase subunit B